MAVAITKERKVNESPNAAHLSLLREYGHAINKFIDGPPVVLTANLPAASAALDGLMLVEQGAGSTRNLIVYTTGLRIRFTGASF